MISDWFSDDELLSQIRMFFTEEESEVIDFEALLGQVKMVDSNTGELNVRGRVFRFDMEVCDVTEVET